MNLRTHFDHISFNAEKHRYFDKSGTRYKSSSSIINDYIPTFDTETIAKKVADRDGIPEDILKAQWRVKRDYSCAKGTDLHLYIEAFLNYDLELTPTTPIQNEINQFQAFWTNNKDRFEFLATELIVADDNLKIAGTIDGVIKNRQSGKVYLIDWKTNNAITFSNDFESLEPPLQHLDHCNFNKYSLQTSLYRRILESSIGLDVTGCLLVHFSPNREYNVIQCSDYRQEINDILKG